MSDYKTLGQKFVQHAVAFRPAFLLVTGSANAAVVLSQLFWHDSKWKREFFVTQSQIAKETGLSIRQVERSFEIIRDVAPFVECVKKGVPCRNFYRFNRQNMDVLIGRAVGLCESKGVSVIPHYIGDSSISDIGDTEIPDIGDTGISGIGDTITQIPTETPTENKKTIVLSGLSDKENSPRVLNDEKKKEGFEDAWVLYQRKGSKKQSLRYWTRLSENDKRAIKAKIPSYVASTPEVRFRKDFQGWINPANRKWEDKLMGGFDSVITAEDLI